MSDNAGIVNGGLALLDWNRQYSGKVALVRYKREWRVCFVETPDLHLTFAGIPYGGKTLKEATADAERMAWKNDFEFVGRLDKLAASTKEEEG